MTPLASPGFLSSVSIPKTSVALLLELAHEQFGDTKILFHPPSVTAYDKQRLLPATCYVQKTVTVLLGGEKLVLVSTIGDTPIHRPQLRVMAKYLNTDKSFQVNPPHIDPLERYHMPIGIVSPFLRPETQPRIDALFILPWQVSRGDVAISLSFWESLCVPVERFPHFLLSYADRAYPHLPFWFLE